MKILAHKQYGGRTVFSAWEPSEIMGPHGTITFVGGECYGRVGTRQIGPEIEAMRGGSPERCAACDAHREAQYTEAYQAILAEYPEAAFGRPDLGEIEVE